MDKKAQLLELLQQKKKEKELATPIGILGTKLDKVVEAVSSIPQVEIPEYPEHPSYPEFPKSMEMSFKGLQTVTLKGDKGDTGDTYTLTEKDKRDIALAIKVPIVEKVIEKTETIIEKPIVTQEIKEVAISDTADTIRNKLEILKGDERLKLDAISGVDKLRNGLLEVMNQGLMSLDKFHGLGIAQSGVKIGNANEINFIGATVKNNSNQGVDVTFSASAGGITSINTDTTAAQTLTVGTSGSDFAIADNGTGDHKFNLPTASSTNRGALSSTDWSTFNNKQSAITTGTTLQYLRGDLSLATLNTLVVPENTNLYFTNARAIASTLTGYTSGAGTISATDTILSAIQKLNGNTPLAANPTASVGLSAVNGSASTFMRSDGAPALSQAIAPTWTGVHTFTPAARTSGTASYLTVTTPTDTGITASTESKGINHVSGTRTWVDGTVAVQREYYFGAPTYNKTTTATTFTDVATMAISGAPIAGTGTTLTHPWGLWVQSGNSHFGGQVGETQFAIGGTGAEFNDSNNTIGGHGVVVQNTSAGTSAYSGVSLGNNQSVDGGATSHFFGMFWNSSTYNDTTFGTAFAIPSLGAIQNSDGPIVISAQNATGYVNFLAGGSATTNEVGRFTTTGLTVGLAGTLTGKVRFAGATSNYIDVVGVAAGGSTTNTLQAVTDTFVYRATTDTLTNKTLTDAVNNISAPGTTTVGYLGMPQNSKSAAYTTVMADAGKHLYHPGADTTARTWTIDSNANVAYPIGTTLTFINDTSGGVITIAITSDTMILAGAGTTGSRTLAANGIATAVKMTSTRWIINGTGLT